MPSPLTTSRVRLRPSTSPALGGAPWRSSTTTRTTPRVWPTRSQETSATLRSRSSSTPRRPTTRSVVQQVADVESGRGLLRRLHAAGGTAARSSSRRAASRRPFISDDGSKDPSFGELAGDSAEGAQVTCPCADPLEVRRPPATSSRACEPSTETGTPARSPPTCSTSRTSSSRRLSELDGDEDIEEVRAHVVEDFQNADGYRGHGQELHLGGDAASSWSGPEDIWVYEWGDAEGNFVSLGPASELIE